METTRTASFPAAAALLRHAARILDRLVAAGRALGLVPPIVSAADPLAPAVIDDGDVATMLASLGEPPASSTAETSALAATREALLDAVEAPFARELGLAALVRTFALSPGALDAFALALAVELDPRAGRLVAFLNNDAGRPRPTFASLCAIAALGDGTGAAEAATALDRALLAPGLLVVDDGDERPRAGAPVRVPVEVTGLMLTSLGPRDDRAAPGAPIGGEDGLRARADLGRGLRGPTRLVLVEGAPGSGRTALALAAVEAAGLAAMCARLPAGGRAEIESAIAVVLLRARLSGRVLVLRSDGVLGAHPELWRALDRRAEALAVRCVVVTRTDEPLPDVGAPSFTRVAPPRPRSADRLRLWADAFVAAGLAISTPDLDDVSARFDLTPGRLRRVVEELARERSATGAALPVRPGDVRRVLRAVTRERLEDHAELYAADRTLDELVLEPAARERLDELVHRMRHRGAVLDGWGFGGPSRRGYGVSALFSGPPGTGKTAAAAAVAHALDVDLYVVDLSRVLSKWVGETEQNLARLFDEAESSGVALLFDEADSLFGKRSTEVRSASDRWANVTVSYLLARMERYAGLAILTSNLESAIDAAFLRRLSTRVSFEPPDERARLALWQALLPRGVRYADDVDLAELARRLDMPGARVRSALVRAAFRATARGVRDRVLAREDVAWAALAEYEDMGRIPHPSLAGEPHAPVFAPPPPRDPGSGPHPLRRRRGPDDPGARPTNPDLAATGTADRDDLNPAAAAARSAFDQPPVLRRFIPGRFAQR